MRKALVSDVPDQNVVTPTVSNALPDLEDDSDEGEWIMLPRIPSERTQPDVSRPTSPHPQTSNPVLPPAPRRTGRTNAGHHPNPHRLPQSIVTTRGGE